MNHRWNINGRYSGYGVPATSNRLSLLKWVMLLVVVGLAITPAGAQSKKTAKPEHVVTIKNMQFEPAEITVAAGESVLWRNEDIFQHTVTADDGSFDSGLISPGKSWRRTFSKPGKIAYHCTPHPNMTGTVVVKGGNTRGK